MQRILFLILALAIFTSCASKRSVESDQTVAVEATERKEPRSLGYKIVMFVPDRLFDLMDIVRLRARVGPGVAVGARVSKYVQAYLGSYFALYAGLPGPRSEAKVPLPIGVETLNGLKLSVLDATATTCFDPSYTSTEIGVSAHLAVVGVDLGIDPIEIVDFFGGFIGADIREDDL